MNVAPIKWASAQELPLATRKLVCNGIGPGRGKTWITKGLWWLSMAFLWIPWALGLQAAFRRCGDDHDLHYFIGGSWVHKLLGDGLFLGQLLGVVSHWGVIWIPFGVVIAFGYALLVVLLGWGSFRHRAEPLAFGDVPPAAETELA